MARKHLRASNHLKHLFGKSIQVGQHEVEIGDSGEVQHAAPEVFQTLRHHEHWSVVKPETETK